MAFTEFVPDVYTKRFGDVGATGLVGGVSRGLCKGSGRFSC